LKGETLMLQEMYEEEGGTIGGLGKLSWPKKKPSKEGRQQPQDWQKAY